jgi:hypothetical protein
MMKIARSTLRVAAIAGMCFAFAGCTQRLGDFTLIASKNIDLSNFNTGAAENSEKVTGEDKKVIICVFPTGIPNLKEAVDRAEEQKDAVGLTNARIDAAGWYIPYIYGESGYTVTGNPVPR